MCLLYIYDFHFNTNHGRSSLSAVCTGAIPTTFVTPTGAPSVSFVSNAYFSFPYIATVFANGASCQSAVDQCNQNYAA